MRLTLSRRLMLASAAIWILASAGCARKTSEVDDAALRAADGDSANWITYGRTYSEQRFSPLKEIDEQSVGKLGLAWSYDLETLRGVEATPLVKDGVIYTTSAWSIVRTPFPFQLDALVQLIFVVALLAFLIRRFAQSRASEQQYVSDLEAARTLQQVLIPESLPDIPGLKIETAYHPAQEVGGDFYDAIKVDDNSVLLAIADVMGKGVPAALFAAILRSLLRALPGQIVVSQIDALLPLEFVG